MFIDVVFLILMVLAVFKGLNKGFIVAIFSFVAFVIGLAAALKLSTVVAELLKKNMDLDGYWLPVLSFLIVFVGLIFFIKWWSFILKKVISLVFLGWIDKLAGVILFALMYLMAYSVILFFATKIHLVSIEAQQASRTYFFIAPFGPTVMSWLGKVIPVFSHMFSDLSLFFEGVSKKAA